MALAVVRPIISFEGAANCPKYATVSGFQATDSIISERCVVGLDVCKAWVPSPASRLCGSKVRRVHIGLTDSNSSCLIHAPGTTHTRYVVMPMRL